ncbi:ras guanine nucleotide exchange factor domain-containing protein [Halteromyces radiatus]|uniref:ras guanine nucleotide exchange factor domain-containing protein n=1 Tax=Halteromyces radiatus TaxID=101107 RepID=UPI0022206E37|nr:ras guanine nucleotide exchange factor domain-containing protein [Halteromyces radiatus]KAI8099017.1 ras guanine nucleotide exchange factor domain-containing protein [Halteromyces radiatus]
MNDTQQLYTEASHLLENGLTKDAYMKFINTVELSTQQLYAVKFVHQTLVSTPAEYDKLLSTIRSSLTQLEHIVVQTSFHTKSPPPLPPKPILPPKPTSKRPVPPLPPLAINTNDLSSTQRRSRANSSVTFADRATNPYMDDEEEEDDEEESIMNTLKFTGSEKSSYPLPLPQQRPTSHSSTEDTSCFIIDPYDLVPAQTNTGESMALPISPTTSTDFYIPNIPAPPLLGMHRQLQHQLDQLLAQQSCDEQQTTSIATVRRLLNNVRTVYMSAMTVPTILEFSPQLVAYQLTLIESAIFRAIPPEALQQHRAISKSPHPNIVASTDFFNYLTRSIEHAILLPQEASHRAEVVHRWIKIATQCLALNNYQTLKAIVSALGTPPIQRLKRTWECIPKKRMNRLEVLTGLMCEADNYSRYREHIRTLIPNNHPDQRLDQSIVPFLGVLIHDMTYVLTAKATTPTLPTTTADTIKDARIQEILDWMRTFQRSPPYSLRPPSHHTKKKNKFFLRQAQALQQYYTPSKASSTTPTTTTAPTLSHVQPSLGLQTVSSDPSGLLLSDSSDNIDSQEQDHLEQQRITHYLLMRPWVNEKIIDELSQLREAPRRTMTAIGNGHSLARTNSFNSILSHSTSARTSYQHHYDSMLSTTSSGSHMSDDYPRSPTSPFLLDDQQHPSLRRSLGSFWPWRKSGEIAKHNMMDSPPATNSNTSSIISNSSMDDRILATTDHRSSPPPTPRRKVHPSLTMSHHQRTSSVPGTTM